MTITIDRNAPDWAQMMSNTVDSAVNQASALNFFVSQKVYDAAGILPDPTKYTNKILLLSNGTFWLAKSNGTNWLYPDGTTV